MGWVASTVVCTFIWVIGELKRAMEWVASAVVWTLIGYL